MKSKSPPTRSRWLPHPALSLLLAAVWLLLQQNLALAQLITAAVLGLGLPMVLGGFLGSGGRLRRLPLALRFAGVVLYDIVVSNVTVARIVLNPFSKPQPAWLDLPLDTRHPVAITLLATIITTTPGTVSCIVDDEAGRILVHALDCSDPAQAVQQMKERYEAPLRLIFEGGDE
ncbi:MAG TPA: Na+/H+ antiporter subunit E [Rubrivivax sp.]|nr:Na+/H+ antiporter subunit E [Rubrivivax sp.]